MIEENEKVSIVIPVYNVEKYLEQCVDSVQNQTYHNLEILLINDGSKDRSGTICNQLSQGDSRIKVYHKENEGLGITRNFGLSHATGQYVIFIDSDDYIDVDLVKSYMTLKDEYKADTVFAGYKKVTNEGSVLFEENYKEENFKDEQVVDAFLPRLIGSLPEKKDSIFRMSCARLYSLDIIKENKITFPSERIIQSEDGVFQFDYLSFAKNVAVGKQAMYNYRENPESLTKIYKKNRFEEAKKVYFYFKERCEKLNLSGDVDLRLAKMLFVELNVALRQEMPSYSGNEYRVVRKKMKTILNDTLLRDILKLYPISKLNIKQRIFLYLVKYKKINLLILSYCMEK